MVGTLYRDLDPNEQEIRVLRILPGDDGSTIRCTLEETSPQNSEFDALSYCWGSSETPDTIELNGISMAVTASLAGALQHFRRVGVGMQQPLWVDAVCINQKNNAERSSQVSFMGELYRCASRVHVWLGDASSISDAAMAAFRDLADLDRRPEGQRDQKWPLPSDKNALKKLEDLKSFADNPYWKRTWILQEIAFAPDCVIHGRGQVVYARPQKFENQSRICSLFDPFGEINCEVRENSNDTSETAQLGVAIEAALHPVRTTGFVGLIRPIAHEPSYIRLLTNICLEYRIMLATDPRDKVYGILGLLPSALEITPNYDKSVRQVFTDLTLEIIRTTKNFAILVDACSGNADLPSWIPDLRVPCPFPAPFTKQVGSHNMSANLPAIASVSDQGVLSTKGLRVDRVKYVRPGSNNIQTMSDLRGHVSDWRSLFEETIASAHGVGNEIDMNNVFWNAIMTSDEDVVGFDTTQVQHYIELLHSPDVFISGRLDPAKEPIKAKLLTVLKRYDIFSTEQGHMGHAPRGHVVSGDCVLMLAGAPAPFCAFYASHSGTKENQYVLRAPCSLMPIDTQPDYVNHPETTLGTVGRFRAKHPIMEGQYLADKAGLASVLDAQEDPGRQAVLDLMQDICVV